MGEFPVGTHCILELFGCRRDLLNDEPRIRQALTDASQQGMSTLLNLTSHRFDPQGVTALALLAESHISIHTWPEHQYAAVDVFTCGEHAQPLHACAFLARYLQADDHLVRVLNRGSASVGQYDAPFRLNLDAYVDTVPDPDDVKLFESASEVALCQARN